MRYSRYIAMLAIAACMVAGIAQLAYAQNTNSGPEFVGAWNLDTAKSDFGKMTPPKSETLTILSSNHVRSLTIVVQRTSVEGEVVSTLPSFRFPELSQPI